MKDALMGIASLLVATPIIAAFCIAMYILFKIHWTLGTGMSMAIAGFALAFIADELL
jgi:hypothetical protein